MNMTRQIDTLLTDLRCAAEANGFTKRKLARMAELHPNTLARFGTDGWMPSVTTIRKLEDLLLHRVSVGS